METYRACIVEDDENARELLTKYLGTYGAERNAKFDATVFSDPLDFLESFRGNFDFIFLDIELPHLNGMEVARRIRKEDRDTIVIFVTNMAQYAVKGYEVDALDFIVKPVQYPAFALKLDRAVERFKATRDKEIWITEGVGKRRLRTSQIKYVEVIHHNVIYHTTMGNFKTYDQLKNISNVLADFSFALCNRCFLVNLRYVTAIKEFSVTVGGEILQISRNKKKSFLNSLNEYLGGK